MTNTTKTLSEWARYFNCEAGKKRAKMNDAKIILADMKLTGLAQASWDWPADLRFAKAVGADPEIEILQCLLKSNAPFPVQIAAYKSSIAKLKNRRLRALRCLEKQGRVKGCWIGTGPGGLSEFGVRRNKFWDLTP